jgi:glycosyltransferase involved in cell wall biosynthesis
VLDFAKSAEIYDNEIFELWPAGIDTTDWKPIKHGSQKDIDVLIYNKIYWDRDNTNRQLLQPIRDFLNSNNYSFSEIAYGNYSKEDYQKKLRHAKVMIFLSAHESQGLAYQECLASNVPVIAWDQGYWLDPTRFKYNRPFVPATSVPFFDERCGATFSDLDEFICKFESFFENSLSGQFNPREFVLEHLSIEKSTDRMLDIYNSV